jgi:hypothetical protein
MKILLVALVVVSLLIAAIGILGLVALNMSRADAVVLLTKWAISRMPALANTPISESHFTDIESLSSSKQETIELAYALGITTGTGDGIFNPTLKTPLWQWALLYGRTEQIVLSH